ncbi:MAG: TolC family protein [Undibacterium sp.]|nr:TolC family protein [Undibacterium sp.]
MNVFTFARRRITVLALSAMSAFLLTACASFSNDGGFSEIDKITKERLGKNLQWQPSSQTNAVSKQRVLQLLSTTLSSDDAVQIALLNNRGLQANFAELGLAEADYVQSGRLLNPRLSFGRLQRGDESEHELGLSFNLVRLLTMPYTRQMELRRFEQTRQQLALQILATASETRKAFYIAVAADQTVLYMQQVKKAADASAELARRMEQAGNFNKLQRAREQSFYADAVVTLARAEQVQIRAREKLIRLLGLSGDQIPLNLPLRLPDLPKLAEAPANIEQLALTQRLDVQAARLATEQLAQNLGLSKATRFINVLEFGVVRNTSNQMSTQRGYEVSLELPIFDWGVVKVAKAEALYMQAFHRTAEIAVNAQSEVRQAYAMYRSSFDIAVHYRDEILPLKKKISDENLLRYNGMFIGVFDLLADARAQIFSVNSAIEAARDFWLAQTDLEMSLIGKTNMIVPTSDTMANND